MLAGQTSALSLTWWYHAVVCGVAGPLLLLGYPSGESCYSLFLTWWYHAVLCGVAGPLLLLGYPSGEPCYSQSQGWVMLQPLRGIGMLQPPTPRLPVSRLVWVKNATAHP